MPWLRHNLRLIACIALCGLVPLVARAYLDHRIRRDLEPALSARLGSPVRVGGLDTSLTGALRLHDVTVGTQLSARTVEAGFDPMALFGTGDLAPAELRVKSPRLRLALSGADELRALAERVGNRQTGPTGSTRSTPGRTWQVVIRDGDLTVDLFGRAIAHLEDVTVQPLADRIRLIAGATQVSWRDPLGSGQAAFTSGALDWPTGSGDARMAWAGGRARIALGAGPSQPIRDLVVRGDRHGLVATGVFDQVAGSRLAVRARRTSDHDSLEIDLDSAPLAVIQSLAPSWLLIDRARVRGQLAVARAQPGSLSIAMDLDFDDAHIDHRRIADKPLPVDGHLSAAGHLIVGQPAQLELDQLVIRRGGVTVRGRGALPLDGPVPSSAELALALDPGDCQALIEAVPAAMRSSLTGLHMTGTATAALALAYHPGEFDLDIDFDLDRCRIVSEPVMANPRRLAGSFAHTLPDGQRRLLGPDRPDFVHLGDLPSHVPAAFVASEDGRFYRHSGFDLRQIERSLAVDLREKRLVRGGSTITQQLVKNLFLARDRTLARKLEEAVLTWRTEAHLSKRRILELYLNIIELGPGIYGVSEAAHFWFDTSPDKLSVAQAAFLAALTPAPSSLSRRIREQGGPDQVIERRVRAVLDAMRKDGYISRLDHDHSLNQPLELRSSALARR